MTTTRVAKTGLHLIAGCSLALLVGAGCGTALAHGEGHNGGGDQPSNLGHGRCIECGGGSAAGTHYTGHNVDGGDWRHRHHHHPATGPGGLGKVHGPGSSHNPVIYHPPVKPIRPPTVHAGPAKLPKTSNLTFCQFQESGGVLRDHRSGSNINGPCPRHTR